MQVTGRRKAEFRERHFDFAMRPDEYTQLKSIAAGQRLVIPFQFDYDAPFALRSYAIRTIYSAASAQNLQTLKMRFADSTKEYRQQNHIRQLVQSAYYGQFGNPLPVFPQILFPAGSTLLVDLYNDGSSSIDNVTIYWRGVKLFPWGQRFDFTYPQKFKTIPYTYTIVEPSTSNPLGGLLNLPVTATLLNQVFKIQDDADFVIRGGQAGLSGNSGAIPPDSEVFIKLYDSDHYPYSNFPIQIDVLFGQFNSTGIFTYANGTKTAAPYGTGPIAPGLFYPEIYLPKTRVLYYDVIRNDQVSYGSGVATFSVLFHGSKVFSQ